MRSAQIYSHLNGVEFLMVHKAALWNEIQAAIQSVDANEAFEKIISQEKTMAGRILYSPSKLNKLFKNEFSRKHWSETRTAYFVKDRVDVAEKTGSRKQPPGVKDIYAAAGLDKEAVP